MPTAKIGRHFGSSNAGAKQMKDVIICIDPEFALATQCIGGGQAIATILPTI
jgi:acetyl-CoA acetyltransferase